MRRRNAVSLLGWAGFVVLLVSCIALRAPERAIALRTLGLWVIACFAFILSSQSANPLLKLVRNAILVSAIAASLTFANHGDAEYDDEGMTISEGFEATTDQRLNAAIVTFATFLPPSLLGIGLAALLRRRNQATTSKRDTAPHEFHAADVDSALDGSDGDAE